jgi:hypothetical protein
VTKTKPKRPKRTHTAWKKRDAVYYLMDMGWKQAPGGNDNPRWSAGAIKRIDALAVYMSKGLFDPSDKGKRSQGRWSKAYIRCERMLESPDWWKQRFPEQFALIDPPTWPGSVTVKRTRIGWHSTYSIKEFGERVFVKDGYLPLYEGDLLFYEKLWDPDYPDDPVRVATAQLEAASKREFKEYFKKWEADQIAVLLGTEQLDRARAAFFGTAS